MDNNYFHKKIKDMIEKCSYDFYTIQPIKEVQCTCVVHATKQADPRCKMCLGTGYKIKIKKIRGACNEILGNAGSREVRGSEAITISKTYFIDNKYNITSNDIFVDNGEIYYVFRITDMRALQGEMTHKEIKCMLLKNDHAITLNNFNEILNKYKK